MFGFKTTDPVEFVEQLKQDFKASDDGEQKYENIDCKRALSMQTSLGWAFTKGSNVAIVVMGPRLDSEEPDNSDEQVHGLGGGFTPQ